MSRTRSPETVTATRHHTALRALVGLGMAGVLAGLCWGLDFRLVTLLELLTVVMLVIMGSSSAWQQRINERILAWILGLSFSLLWLFGPLWLSPEALVQQQWTALGIGVLIGCLWQGLKAYRRYPVQLAAWLEDACAQGDCRHVLNPGLRAAHPRALAISIALLGLWLGLLLTLLGNAEGSEVIGLPLILLAGALSNGIVYWLNQGLLAAPAQAHALRHYLPWWQALTELTPAQRGLSLIALKLLLVLLLIALFGRAQPKIQAGFVLEALITATGWLCHRLAYKHQRQLRACQAG